MAHKAPIKEYGLGRRKSSIGRVWLTTSTTDKIVNGISLTAYFPTIASQITALSPLTLTSTMDKYGLNAIVSGGGKSSQVDALKLAIARALLATNKEWHKQLKAAHMLTRDYRAKERKKPGLKRARRAPQFSKR